MPRTAQEAKEYINGLKETGMSMKDITKLMMIEAKASNGATVATKERVKEDKQKVELLEAIDMNAGVANLDNVFGGLPAKFIDWNSVLFMKKEGLGGRENKAWCTLFVPLSSHKNVVIPEEVKGNAQNYIKLMEEHIVALQAVVDWADTLEPIQVNMPASKHKIGDIETSK